MTAYVYTDGASRANPGPAAFGVWVEELGRGCWGVGKYLGAHHSNNVAEYQAVLAGLRYGLALLAHQLFERCLQPPGLCCDRGGWIARRSDRH